MPSASIVPFISGSTRSLNAEIKLNLNFAIVLSGGLTHSPVPWWRSAPALNFNRFDSSHLAQQKLCSVSRVRHSQCFWRESRANSDLSACSHKQTGPPIKTFGG